MNTHHKTVVIQDLREPIFTLKQPKNMFIVTYSEINQRESEHRYINWPFAFFFLLSVVNFCKSCKFSPKT